jgi:hypothetical protein
MNGAFASPKPSSPQTTMVDDMIRRALSISNPWNPDQVAAALLQRYPDVARLEQDERAGLSHSSLPAAASAAGAGGGAVGAELIQVGNDLDRDLLALATASQLKNIDSELAGWGRVIRSIVADGLAAAHEAFDASAFNRVLAARSDFREYARIARFVGALSDGCGGLFRSLAQSLDSYSGVMLVVAANTIESSGVTRGTAIVRISPSDVQMRRNAVVMALRNLTGSTQIGTDQERWPRGIEAYRGLIGRIEAGGHADLRTLLEENALAHAMDSLVDLATGAGADGLKDLATASALLVQRFEALIQIGRGMAGVPGAAGAPESPPLVSFMSALQLFVDAFSTSGSLRLLYIARPPIIAYGRHGMGGPDAGAERLIALTTLRGSLAEEVDCFAGCGCDANTLRCQILLDYLLFAVDRAIDCYAVGTDPDGKGEPERRAAVTGLLIHELRSRFVGQAVAGQAAVGTTVAHPPICAISGKLKSALDDIKEQLLHSFLPLDKALIISELQTAYRAEGQIERLVRSLSSSCHVEEVFRAGGMFGVGYEESPIRTLFREVVKAAGGNIDSSETIHIPPTLDESMERVVEAVECHASQTYATPPPPPPPIPSPPPPPPAGHEPVASAQPASDHVTLFYAVAIGPKGNADSDSRTGLVVKQAGYASVQAIATAERDTFIQAMKTAAASSGPGLVKDLTVEDLEQIHKLAANVQAAFNEQKKKP